MLCSLLVSLVCALSPGRSQETPAAAVDTALEHATPEAKKLWESVCRASGAAERAPLSAFRIQAQVRTRSGMGRNDVDIDYSYLAPDCIRFILPNKKETGRFGPAPEQYWLRDGDQIVILAGREYKEDRRAVDDMLALARNYVALSNPARLQLVSLELPAAPPADLGPERAKRMKKLRWLVLESPDFALVRSESSPARGTLYRVELGLNEHDLPAVAIVRAKAPARADPLLVEFSNYQSRQPATKSADSSAPSEQGKAGEQEAPPPSFQLPFQLFVYVLDAELSPPAFAVDASQEVYVTNAELQPPLTTDDFQAKRKESKAATGR